MAPSSPVLLPGGCGVTVASWGSFGGWGVTSSARAASLALCSALSAVIPGGRDAAVGRYSLVGVGWDIGTSFPISWLLAVCLPSSPITLDCTG